MTTMVEALFQAPPIEVVLYPPGSRYQGIAVAVFTLPSGRVVRHLRRRFLPDPLTLVTIVEHRVVDADRLDNLAARYLGDPLAAWRIGDANGTLRIESLVEETGRRLRVTLPEGVTGTPNA
jgi:hypothetical protein